MFPHLQLSDWRERWAVGLADALLTPVGWLSRLRPASASAPSSVLLLRLERIGDLLMAREAIRAVRARAPRARIDLAVGSWNEPLARLLPEVDQVEVLDAPWLARDGTRRSVWDLFRRARRWRARRYDLGINFEGDIRSNVLLWLSGATRRVGFDMAGGGPVLTARVAYDTHAHVAANSMALVERAFANGRAAAVSAERPAPHPPRLVLPAGARARAAELVDAQSAGRPSRVLVGIHASGGREIKQWEPSRFAEVAAALVRSHGATIVLTGSDGDRPLVDRLKAGLPPEVQAVDLSGALDIVTLAAVLERLTVFITGDTGPMHLASAVGTPVVALFGPSAPERWGPLTGSARVVRVDLPCSPCNRIRRPPARCLGHVPDCMAGITVAQVCEAAGAAIAAAREDGGTDAR